MESTIIGLMLGIIFLLVISLIFRGIGFVIKTVTNPRLLLTALVICIIVMVASKVWS